ncbi:hypothetical protein ACTQ9L_00470 [Deinococcus wulumuqiensis]
MLGPHIAAAELSRLAHSPDAAVRAAVAAHPNTPPPVLAELGAEFPAEVLGNPALPLLRLAQPGLLAGWPAHTLEALTTVPGAPDWLLRLAAAHEKIDVQLAAVTRSELPGDVLERLSRSPFWTIREYVARKPQLPPGVLAHLARDLDYGVRLTVANRPGLPPDLRHLLRRDPHPLVQAVILLAEGERG